MDDRPPGRAGGALHPNRVVLESDLLIRRCFGAVLESKTLEWTPEIWNLHTQPEPTCSLACTTTEAPLVLWGLRARRPSLARPVLSSPRDPMSMPPGNTPPAMACVPTLFGVRRPDPDPSGGTDRGVSSASVAPLWYPPTPLVDRPCPIQWMSERLVLTPPPPPPDKGAVGARPGPSGGDPRAGACPRSWDPPGGGGAAPQRPVGRPLSPTPRDGLRRPTQAPRPSGVEWAAQGIGEAFRIVPAGPLRSVTPT